MKKNNRLLSNLLIYPEFQSKFILLMLGLSLLNPIILLLFQFFAFNKMRNVALQFQLPVEHPYVVFLNRFESQFYGILSITVIISIILCVVLGLLITHKAAGPLVKMKNKFDQVAENKKVDGPIPFRQKDFFKELSESYNRRFK